MEDHVLLVANWLCAMSHVPALLAGADRKGLVCKMEELMGIRRKNFFMEGADRDWRGLPREVWSTHPWRCPRTWHSVLWAG